MGGCNGAMGPHAFGWPIRGTKERSGRPPKDGDLLRFFLRYWRFWTLPLDHRKQILIRPWKLTHIMFHTVMYLLV